MFLWDYTGPVLIPSEWYYHALGREYPYFEEGNFMRAPVKKTGPGKYMTGKNGDGDISVKLFNFDINGSEVKENHRTILRSTVIEILKAGGSVAILGHASTT